MPIGVPADQIDAKVLRDLQEPGRATMFGLGGGAVFLTSASVRLEDLAELATQSAMAKAVPYESLLTFGPAPGRPRGHVSSWDDGTARLDPMSDADRAVLRESRSALRGPRLLLDVTVDGYPLPADPTMRGTDLFGRFQGGAAQVAVQELRLSGPCWCGGLRPGHAWQPWRRAGGWTRRPRSPGWQQRR
jgi:hypothetical protein